MASASPEPCKFVALSDGHCHYRIDGPADAPALLLIHGATVPAWQFDRLVPYLVEYGLRTIRFDLFGHGYSARPACAHSMELFTRQVLELMDHLHLHEPIDLLGHSFGAAVGARLLSLAPERFNRVVMAAPLLDFFRNSPWAHLLRLPWLGECLMQAYVVPMLMRRRARRYRGLEGDRFVALFREQIQLPGFGRSLLSLLRCGALSRQHEHYAALCALAHPVLLVRGSEDTVIPAHQMREIYSLLPQASVVEMAGASHAMMLTHPQLTASILRDFLG